MVRGNRKWEKQHSEELIELKWLEVRGEWGKMHSEKLSDFKRLEVTGNGENYIVRSLVTSKD
jgi:hypothetical protein